MLIDGKRRHSTANLAVDNGSPYSGAASVDLGLIPVSAIDHVEVLQDGAAAQYGSDAIGGVINIILKHNNEGGSFSATGEPSTTREMAIPAPGRSTMGSRSATGALSISPSSRTTMTSPNAAARTPVTTTPTASCSRPSHR